MQITLDISSIPYNRGVSRYTSNLVYALQKHPEVTLQILGYSLRQKDALTQFVQAANIAKKYQQLWQVPPKLLSTWWYEFPLLNPELFLQRTEVFHAWEELVPDLPKTPVVVTLHDLAILKFPETAHPSTLYKHTRGWQRIKENHMHVIAVSKSTKQDIIELLDIPKDHVHLIYEALPAESVYPVKEEDTLKVQQKYHVDKPFILFVGTLEPRKNLNRLITAWQPLAKHVDLVIAGEVGWEQLDTHLVHQPKLLGRVLNKELAALYKMAKVFAYPSLYEGFGLPILEAFHYGTPVVTSNVSALPEVAGNAAVLVDPLEVESITKGLTQILDENKPEQTLRRQQMKIRSQLFSWEKVADKTISVYQKAIEDFS